MMEEINETKIAVVAIIVDDFDAVERVNEVLHCYRDLIIGRQGIPYRDKGVSVITVVIDATSETINSLSGKLGMIKGVKSKVLTAK